MPSFRVRVALVAPTITALSKRQADDGGVAVGTGLLGDDTGGLADERQRRRWW